MSAPRTGSARLLCVDDDSVGSDWSLDAEGAMRYVSMVLDLFSQDFF